ncbi:formate dehydrogenase subunit gamma [Granulosicoccaceae sp. 1_MG-2023]|nr:formate dehydrogenase subunit gamma [Granulosicoccaceae sp. 1_MG-2023]
MQTPSPSREELRTLIDARRDEPGALLPLLHDIQNTFGYINAEAVSLLADALQQTEAEIHGVISFYHQFRTTPPARHRVQICRAEACQARGARSLEAHACKRLGVSMHGMTADQHIQLDPVYCLGNCATGPNVRIDNRLAGRVDAARFDRLMDELEGEHR